MSNVKHEISINHLDDGLTESRSISFDVRVCDYYGLNENNKEKKILQLTISVIEEVIENEKIVSWGRKDSNFIFDFELKDKEDIYGFACALSCILDNGLNHALSKPGEKRKLNLVIK